MLYLFNSAFRPQYVTNVLNTLNFPCGAVNRYQYSENSNGRCYVHETAYKANCKKGEDVLIVFIDREVNDNFRFIPLRKGKFVKILKSAGVFYYYVQLGEVCSVKDVASFTAEFKTQMQEKLFNISIDGIETGYFAFKNELPVISDIQTSEEAWKKTCDDITSCEYFRKIYPVFTRFCLNNSNDEILEMTKHGRHSSKYKLRLGKTYNAMIDYYIADANLDPGKSFVELLFSVTPDKFSGDLREQRLGARTGMAEYRFSADALAAEVSLSYAAKENKEIEKEIVIANSPIKFRVCRRISNQIYLFLSVVVLIISNLVVAFPVRAVLDPSNAQIYGEGAACIQRVVYNIAKYLDSVSFFLPACAGVASSLATFFMVYLFNKKEK